ncbi:MAG: DUF1640 domain-containing protein [Burkholderiales bacterium]
MTEKIFDTHEYVKELIGAGFTELQAETIARKQVELIESHLATKRDLRELENRLVLKLGGYIGIVALLMKFVS